MCWLSVPCLSGLLSWCVPGEMFAGVGGWGKSMSRGDDLRDPQEVWTEEQEKLTLVLCGNVRSDPANCVAEGGIGPRSTYLVF